MAFFPASYLPAFLSGLALSASLIVAIGAQNTFVLRQGLLREHVGPIVLFCAGVDILLMSAGVAGIGALLREIPNLVLVMTLGGAGFLAWYGAGALRRAFGAGVALSAEGQGRPSLGTALARAAGFTLLNPHVYLDTMLLVGGIGAAQPVGAQPLFVAGASVASAAWFAGLGYGARLLTPLFARPAAWRVLDGAVGATMLLLAAALVRQALMGGP